MAANRRGFRVNRRRTYSTSEFPVPNRGMGKLHRSDSSAKYQLRDSIKTGSSSRPRRRLLDGVNQDKLRRALKITAFLAVIGIGVGAIIVSLNSGGRELPTAQLVEPSTSDVITASDIGATVNIALGGGIKLQNEVLSAAQSGAAYDFNSYISELSEVMNADLSLVSVIGTVNSTDSSGEISAYPSPNYPTELSAALSNIGVNAAAQANQYSVKNGYEAMCASIDSLSSAGITALGVRKNAETGNLYEVKNLSSIHVGIASYNCLTAGEINALKAEQASDGFTNEQISNCSNQLDISKASATILSDVAAMREAGAKFVIVVINWGSAELTAPNYAMRSLAQDMIDNGVDVTLGTGIDRLLKVTVKKHSSDGVEKNCYVFYSLGNLLSDKGSGAAAEERQSMVVNLTLRREAGSQDVALSAAYYHPIYLNRDETHASDNTYLKYRALPAAAYVDASVRPEAFSTDQQWTSCKNTFTSIRTKIQSTWRVGDYLVLGTVEKVGEQSNTGGGDTQL